MGPGEGYVETAGSPSPGVATILTPVALTSQASYCGSEAASGQPPIARRSSSAAAFTSDSSSDLASVLRVLWCVVAVFLFGVFRLLGWRMRS